MGNVMQVLPAIHLRERPEEAREHNQRPDRSDCGGAARARRVKAIAALRLLARAVERELAVLHARHQRAIESSRKVVAF